MYGLDEDGTRPFGTKCLLARRLVEQGVRFVQVYHDSQWVRNASSGTIELLSEEIRAFCADAERHNHRGGRAD
jgi:hypothetical protein